MEQQGYSPEPPTGGRPGTPPLPPVGYLNRLPRVLERMGVTAERMRELARLPVEELVAPGLYTGDSGRPWEGLSPEVAAGKYPLYVWMLNVLAIVCRENLTDGESAALAIPLWSKAREWVDAGRTPPQVWARFGDPQGYWYASVDHGWKGKAPTLTDVARKWDAAGGSWQRRGAPAAATGGQGQGTDAAKAAWEAVQRAIRRFGRTRQAELLATLDDVTRATVRGVGLSRLLDMDPNNDYEARTVRRAFATELAEQRERLVRTTPAPDDAALAPGTVTVARVAAD